MLDYRKYAEGMAMLCEIYQRQATDILLRAYYEALRNLSGEQFESACMHVLKTKTFFRFPLPAELIECVAGNADDRARVALVKVEGAMAQVGRYRSVVFDDPGIHRAVNAMGGWCKLCDMPEDEWKFARQDFMKTFKAVCARDDMPTPAALAGFCEIQNDANGHSKTQVQVEYFGKKVSGGRHEELCR